MVVKEEEANKKDSLKQKQSKLLPVLSVRENTSLPKTKNTTPPERATPVAASPVEVYVDGGTDMGDTGMEGGMGMIDGMGMDGGILEWE